MAKRQLRGAGMGVLDIQPKRMGAYGAGTDRGGASQGHEILRGCASAKRLGVGREKVGVGSGERGVGGRKAYWRGRG